jgi:hypothetical protein
VKLTNTVETYLVMSYAVTFLWDILRFYAASLYGGMTLFSPVCHRFRGDWLNFDYAAKKQGLPRPPYLQPRAEEDIRKNNLTADQNCIQGRTAVKTEDVRNFDDLRIHLAMHLLRL